MSNVHVFRRLGLCVGVTAILGGCSSAPGTSASGSEATESTSSALSDDGVSDNGVSEKAQPSGIVQVFEDFVGGNFFASGDGTVYRDQGFDGDGQDCVGRVYNNPPNRPAGALTVKSASLGSPLVIEPDPNFGFYDGFPAAPPFVFPVGDHAPVTLKLAGSSTDPRMDPTTLFSSDTTFINVRAPVIPTTGPNAGVIVVDSTKAFDIRWDPPKGRQPRPDSKLTVALWDLVGSSGASFGEIRCGFDLQSGHGRLPRRLLSAVKNAVDPVNPIQGAAFHAIVGDWTEVRDGGVSYVIELGPEAATNDIPFDNFATLE